mmetsp:Transcript_6718/g.13515  ORF Transcript_6718/g.13515 Transcript_6718/m.13515 type:complete len:499 (-) Transcript_6718:375-1871(-)
MLEMSNMESNSSPRGGQRLASFVDENGNDQRNGSSANSRNGNTRSGSQRGARTGNQGVDAMEDTRAARLQERMIEAESEESYLELLYSFGSFRAIFFPVAITMIATALTVVYINDGSNGNGEGGLTTLPTVRDESDETSSAGKISAAALNALVIVAIITAATFLMVILYKFNCYRLLVAWLMLSTCLLLVLTTSYPVQIAFLVYNVPFDSITFWIFFYNFGICGVLAIFYQKGMHPIVGQFYLVAVSVVMAWVLLRVLPEYTSWALLVLLALYDLCAVLTPCGPLNLLIGIANEKEDRGETRGDLPGLLYEARVHREGRMERSSDPRSARRASNQATSIAPLAGIMFMADTNTTMTNHRMTSMDMGEESSDNESEPPQRPQPSRPAHLQEQPRQDPMDYVESEAERFADRHSIKLGLGDFVFYSVLCGRAALQGFSTFAAIFVTVFAGLAGTLVLLAMYQRALPALPISILIGVPLYFVCELLITPMTETLELDYEGI